MSKKAQFALTMLAGVLSTQLALAAPMARMDETAGMDPDHRSGAKMTPKTPDVLPAIPEQKGKAAPLTGYAAMGETAGMDPQNSDAGTKVSTKK